MRRREWRGDSDELVSEVERQKEVKGKCVDDPVCGPDVTDVLHEFLRRTNQAYNGLTREEQVQVCDTLFPLTPGHLLRFLFQFLKWAASPGNEEEQAGIVEEIQMVLNASGSFEIFEFENKYHKIESYGKEVGCLLGPPCQGTVQVEEGCYKAWAVNYALYGRFGDLCNRSRFEVLTYVKLFKVVMAWAELGHLVRRGYRFYHVRPAQEWAAAGFTSARAPAPPSQVPQCERCDHAYTAPLTGMGPLPIGTRI